MDESGEEHLYIAVACIAVLNTLFERLPEAIEECALDALDAVHGGMLKHDKSLDLVRQGLAFLEYACVDDARMIVISSGCERRFGFISDFLTVFAVRIHHCLCVMYVCATISYFILFRRK
jgi:hypothetical protein